MITIQLHWPSDEGADEDTGTSVIELKVRASLIVGVEVVIWKRAHFQFTSWDKKVPIYTHCRRLNLDRIPNDCQVKRVTTR